MILPPLAFFVKETSAGRPCTVTQTSKLYLNRRHRSTNGIFSRTERIRQIHREIVKLKQREEFGVKYMMEWEERIYDRMEAQTEGRAEGRVEGRVTATVDFVRNAVEKLGISLEKACEIANISIEKYNEYLKLYR